MESFDPVTSQGLSILSLFWLELVISGLLLACVVVLLGVALIRFRAPAGDQANARQVEGNRRLEIIWTAMPAAVLAAIFILVISTMSTVNAAQSNAEPLVVTGYQWWWQFTYPNQQAITANEMHVPVGVPMQVSLESADVIHSFHVVQFGWMQDLIPGKTNSMWITVVRPGTFDGTCNQYCGLQHAWMRIRVVAEPTEQFNAWVQGQAQSVTPRGSAGEQVFVKNTCVSCHTIRGLPGATGSVGPDLTHLASRSTLGAGVIDNTPDNLRAWIRDAQAIKPGVLMPAFGLMSPADLSALVDYLDSLR
jgi:cytochrome c oxidase subunit 2